MPDIAPYFLIYVALFRLAIIAAGVVSIVLGYRLFCKDNWADTPIKGTDVDAKIPGASFKLRNAAPGSVFVFLGVITIVFMLAQEMPEFDFENRNQIQAKDENGSEPVTSVTTLKMKGDNTIEAWTKKCIEDYDGGKGQIDEAIDACHKAITPATKSMNNLAWIYQKQGKVIEAFGFAKIAVVMNPQKKDYLKTLATILCQAQTQNDDALHWMDTAIKQEPNYEVFSERLEKYQQIRCGSK